ncbi:MAG: hydrogenase expression/formation protein HypE [Bacteroidales bacterium]|nr:hydrogenase expression/formation protein HypE [Bacteroidales bacterium]
MEAKHILIGHGSGGRLSRDLIRNLFVKYFSNPFLDGLGDASLVSIRGSKLAFTTDSYVIDPIFFPGGNIGQLAVSGTVNDLSVAGAIPEYLTAGFIIEEGLSINDLERIVQSMAEEANRAGVSIVAGDTKVVKKGQCDKLFINTSGIGHIPEERRHIQSGERIETGDKILLTGTLGDHAIAILSARENLEPDEAILSDAAPLNLVTELALQTPADIAAMHDITRGGLATILCETCENRSFGIKLYEDKIPVKQSVKSICELYGFDPLYLANEGKIMMIVKKGTEDHLCSRLREEPLSKDAVIIGEVTGDYPGRVVMQSFIGGMRNIDMLSGEMLPRIC